MVIQRRRSWTRRLPLLAQTVAILALVLLLVQTAYAKDADSSSPAKEAYCSPLGPIADARCEYQTIEKVNRELSPILTSLVQTSFFRYWKTALHKDCPFWQENPLCVLRDCSVIEAEDSEIPEHWKTASLSVVDRSPLGSPFNFMEKSCEFEESDFCVVEDEWSTDGSYVDLIKNPERFTGYSGESPERIWRAIYQENCFGYPNQGSISPLLEPADQDAENTCIERRVFYRLISGLHSSISTHICDQYLDRNTGVWMRNLTCFADRVGNHPDRIQNMYFTYTILLRAIEKLSPFLRDHEVHHFCTGNGADTQKIEDLVTQVGDLSAKCGPTFDETSMFVGPDSQILKEQFKTHFRNISLIMDCVGCEKCRLWGKLQISGLGTALKVLFSYGDKPELYRLTRGEVVALFNTLHRLSESVEALDRFRDLHEKQGLDQTPAPELAEESRKMSKLRKPSPPFPTSSLPPLPLIDLLNYTNPFQPTYYFSYILGSAILLYGVVKIARRGWQLHKGTIPLPEGWEERNGGKGEDIVVEKRVEVGRTKVERRVLNGRVEE
ncbi:uncharacterized protein EV422DRAFT_552090 [Fimicolochytrium jonesii]|uniref:uncharacterized protein n=1 Tax=Fimicolochytrium jonesii TaxID=1396493 RepID=UPI0022FEECCF|nr:uncharacterized protein EV422DRAFT_552090 [Fimicolochytrium jonesii]KAI8826710.1 hypothetical protein EV422DRAFT_552090 [Fimicolochytrium jonesii]